MRIVLLWLLLAMGLQIPLQAQLLPLFLNNRDHVSIINPAMTGIPLIFEQYKRPRDYAKTLVGLSTRLQFSKFGGNSPLTHVAKFSQKVDLGDSDHFLWGSAFFMQDRTGPVSLLTTGINTSLHYYLGGNHYMQVGLSLRMTQSSLNQEKINAKDEIDPIITENFTNEWFLNSGIGVLYSGPAFYVGGSMPNTVLQDRTQLSRVLSNHYYGVAGVYVPISGRSTWLEPNVWIRYVQDFPTYYNASIRFRTAFEAGKSRYGHPVWVGVGYDSIRALHIEFGFWFDKLKLTIISTQYPGKSNAFGSGIEGGINLVL